MITEDTIYVDKDGRLDDLRAELLGSLLSFCQFFYKRVTQRDLIVSNPPGRESHHISLCKAYTQVELMNPDYLRLAITMPPGYGKSLFTCMFVAWSYARNPACNFLYISYSLDLSIKHTTFIRSVMTDPIYQLLFGVQIRRDSNRKDNFTTTAGGSIKAFGSGGAVTGQDAGLPAQEEFSGCVIVDDAHKPNEVHSDTMRASVIRNYEETIRQRVRGKHVQIVFIGQRLHEDDLAGFFEQGKDALPWKFLNLPALDDKDMALYPEVHDRHYLMTLREKSPYTFWSQFQQKPVPAGGALFKREWFVELDEEPEIISTFITADTAETEKEYNDATVFSFWGLYEIESMGAKTGQYGLHWIDCMEIRVEPALLLDHFHDFLLGCNRYNITPTMAAIEKKSTGVTLLSELKNLRGIQILDVGRTKADGSKADRFIQIQRWVAEKRISINRHARHKELVLSHMEKITANMSHRNDDIADTLVDAIQIALVDKRIHNKSMTDNKTAKMVTSTNTIMINKPAERWGVRP